MQEETKEQTTVQLEQVKIPEQIRISEQALNILRKLHIEMENKKKEYEESQLRLHIAVLVSLTARGISESDFDNWKTNLDLGVHIKNI
jgi:hypothetical protein